MNLVLVQVEKEGGFRVICLLFMSYFYLVSLSFTGTPHYDRLGQGEVDAYFQKGVGQRFRTL